MAYTDIEDPSAHFQTAYTGTNACNMITNDGNSDLKPDFIWSKRRDAAYNHHYMIDKRSIQSSLSLILQMLKQHFSND